MQSSYQPNLHNMDSYSGVIIEGSRRSEQFSDFTPIPCKGFNLLCKAKRYGKEFCALIKKYCEENDIERPEELRVRTVAKKSMLKVSIIQSIDRQIALDDLAEAKGLDFDDLLDEIEAIVYSGTKLNIDYFIEEVIDDEHVDDIYDYFMESDTDDLDTAQNELGEDYSEDEIRLVRIKFLSEQAN